MTERDIFIVALQKEDPAQRQSYLDEACAHQPELRKQVENLLQLYEGAGSFLEKPAAGSAATGPFRDAAGQAAAHEIPGTIGPYKLVEQIGEGGMGSVWMAQQTEPVKRLVALKLIKAGMDSRQVVARFEAERQALALMDHPNIARVLDAGTTDAERPYFVMDLVRGVPITTYCDEHHLTPRQRLELFVPVCQAIQHAHQKGVIHRDIKPSNVLVALYDGKPVPKVIDFGIAKAAGQPLTDMTLVTGFGAIVGTPEYMSPEQAEVNQLDIDTRSDVYSLGVLLYELLAGSPPFSRKDLGKVGMLEMLRVIREQEPSKPSTKLSSSDALPTLSANRGTEPAKLTKLVRGELDWIVLKALEKDRSRRYETANGFAQDVQRYLADEAVQACPPSAGYRLRKFVRRNRAMVTTTLLFTALLLTAAIVSTLLAIRATNAERLAEQRFEAEKTERARAEAAVLEGKKRLYQARLAQARANRWSGLVGQRYESLDALAEAGRLARELVLDETHLLELRNEAIACLALVDVRSVREVGEDSQEASYQVAAFDADFTHFAGIDENGNVSIRRLDDSREVARLPTGQGAFMLNFHPAGHLLAVRFRGRPPTFRGNLEVWDWRQKKVVFQPRIAVPYDGLRFSPGGQHLALAHKDGTVTIHEASTGQEVRRLSAAKMKPTFLAFSRDGAKLAIWSRQDPEVRIHDVATGRLDLMLAHPGPAMGVDWHPNNAMLATAGQDGRVRLWDVQSGVQRATLLGHETTIYGVEFSPDGNLLLSSAAGRKSILWDPWTGQQLLAVPDGLLTFSRDGQRAVGQVGKKLKIYEVAQRREFRTSPIVGLHKPDYFWTADFSPDGRWLAAGIQGKLKLWDLQTGQALPIPETPADVVRFHPKKAELFVSQPGGLSTAIVRHEAGSLRIRATGKLPIEGNLTNISLDREGRLLAAVRQSDGSGWVVNLDRPADAPRRIEHKNAACVSVSPRGDWIATGPFQTTDSVRIWNAQSGKLEHTLEPKTSLGILAFSPDNRWLAAGSHNEITVREVGSWQVVRRQPTGTMLGLAAYSGNGSILSLKTAHATIPLVDPATGDPFATIQPHPHLGDTGWQGLSPGGSKLITGITEHRCIGIWDLRAIREGLGAMGLDWGLPPYPPAAPSELGPVRVELELGAPILTGYRASADALSSIAAEATRSEVRLRIATQWTKEGRDAEAKRVIEELMADQDRLETELAGNPRNLAELAAAQQRLGAQLRQVGHIKEGQILLQRALGNHQKLVAAILAADFPPAEGADQLHNLAVQYRNARDLATAEKICRQALEIAKKLAAEAPAETINQLRLASVYGTLGTILSGVGRYQDAADAHRGTLAVFEQLTKAFPDEADYRWGRAVAENFVGVALRNFPDQREAAIRHHQRAREICEALIAKSPANTNYRSTLVNSHYALGIVRRLSGRWVDSVASYRQALEASEPRPEQAGTSWDTMIASIRSDLAWLLCMCPEEKVRDPRRAVELAKKLVETDPQSHYWKTLGIAQYRAGSFKEALAALDKSMGLRNGGDSVEWFFVAMSHERLGAKAEARRSYDRAVQWVEKNQPKNPELARLRAEAATTLAIEKQEK